MKYSNLKAFEKHLESASPNHLSELYLVMSKEGFDRKTACEKIVSLALPEICKPGENYFVFDAAEDSFESIWQEMQSMSFLTKKKVIVVTQADQISKAMQDRLRRYFAKSNPGVCLILESSAINRATSFYKDIEKSGVVLDILEEKSWEKEKSAHIWVAEQLKANGKRMDAQAISLFVKLLGTERSSLHQEIEKIVCYVGDRDQITSQDISAICIKISQDNAWQLGESIFSFNASEAMRTAKALLAEGVALIALLRQIRSQFQTDYQVCCLIAQGKTPQDVSLQFPYMKGAILNKHLQQAQSYGLQRFKKGMLAIDQTELLAKNSPGDPEWLTERLIFTLAIK